LSLFNVLSIESIRVTILASDFTIFQLRSTLLTNLRKNVNVITDTLLEVQIRIVKKDGTLPASTAKVAPVNNILCSLFESVRLYVNDRNITGSPGYYPYKCYISNVLTYSTIVKGSQLQTQGYYPDLSGHFDDGEDNTGFAARNLLFRKGFASEAAYREEGATFIGRLYHDLTTCESGMPPGVKLKFELEKAKDEFLLLIKPTTGTTDKEQYKIKIENIVLLMPIAQLTQGVFNEYNSILTRQIDNKPVGISYRKVEIRPLTLPRNSENFYSELLFSDDMPLRCLALPNLST